MSEDPRSGDNELKAALGAANRLIDRLQDETVSPLKPDSPPAAAEEALLNITDELEAAPEVSQVREAAGEDSAHYGSGDEPPGRVEHPSDNDLEAQVANARATGTSDAET